jgi:tRNA modification GTPase
MVTDALLAGGATSAEPGEFTARAFFNGRLDLAAAEGVAGIIAAQNQQELTAARQLMAGELSRRLQPILDQLADTLALVETGLDFSEEDITILDRSALLQRVRRIKDSIAELSRNSGRFASLPSEPTIVLFGRPNAGKSSLLNALTSSHRAVVSATAGTTRDALSTTLRLRRGFARIVDVAGVDSSEASGEIGNAMQHTAWRAAGEADVLVLVRDATDDRPDPILPGPVDLIVHTKTDLRPIPEAACGVSAINGDGLDNLRDRLDDLTFRAPQDFKLSLNSRHEQAIEATTLALDRILLAGTQSAEIDAMELREALDSIGSIIGMVRPDEILGRIFSTFCIGK